MPVKRYRRRSYRKRYSRRASRWGTYKAAGMQLWRDVKWLKSVINVEKKYIDYTVTAQNMTNTGAIPLINGLSLGDTATTRDGQSVKFISITYKGDISMSNSAETSFARVAFVLDRQSNAQSPSITNIWQSASPTALRVIGTGYRFRVIRDMQFALSNGGRESVYFERTIKLRFHTRFNTGNAGDVTDIVTNALYLVYLSDQATNYPVINMNIRIKFIDN